MLSPKTVKPLSSSLRAISLKTNSSPFSLGKPSSAALSWSISLTNCVFSVSRPNAAQTMISRAALWTSLDAEKNFPAA
jgi:hypothetical protein